MRKIILMMLLAAVNSNAAAEWVEVGYNENNIVYADPTTIRKAGNRVKMWDLMDYKTVTETGYMSSKTQYEYDCKKEKKRELFIYFYSGNMGGGNIIFSGSTSGDWEPIIPGATDVTLWKFACKKR